MTNLLSTPLVKCLKEHMIIASVVDVDHYRIQGGLSIETDYIIFVRTAGSEDGGGGTGENAMSGAGGESAIEVTIEPFHLAKTYAMFRNLAAQLKREADKNMAQQKTKPSDAFVSLCNYCNSVFQMVDSQRTQYFGKVNYTYVKTTAQKRKELLDVCLKSTCKFYPKQAATSITAASTGSAPISKIDQDFLDAVTNIVAEFLLTDHLDPEDEDEYSREPVRTAENRETDTSSSAPSELTRTKSTAKAAAKVIAAPLKFLSHTGKEGLSKIHSVAMTATESASHAFNLGGKSSTADASSAQQAAQHSTVQCTTHSTQHGESDNTGQSAASHTSAESLASNTSSTRVAVIPMSTRKRMSLVQRAQEEKELLSIEEPQLVVDRESSKSAAAQPHSNSPSICGGTKAGTNDRTNDGTSAGTISLASKTSQTMPFFLENNPTAFAALMLAGVIFLKYASRLQVSVDADLCLLLIFASFCIGLHTPRPIIGGYDSAATVNGLVVVPPGPHARTTKHFDRSGRALLRHSIMNRNPPNPPPLSKTASASVEGDKYSSKTASEVSADQLHSVGSIGSIEDDEDEDAKKSTIMGSPLMTFPTGAKIGSVKNCWSEPPPDDFQVRGPNYFKDKKKIGSAEYLFPGRGMDLFLTDSCPENVGANPGVFGGRMRELPTFLINFRLPWGVLVFYFEIPDRFIPFLRFTEEKDTYQLPNGKSIPSLLQALSPPERTTAQFLMASPAQRDKLFKIIPVVVDGPWVVKSVVGGKPAIIGKKVPINWIYTPPSVDSQTQQVKKHLFLEADLDIAASSAARSILSVTRSYTQVLTLNLGFVVEAVTDAELPEQMLIGARLHGIDPLTASSYPQVDDDPYLPSDQQQQLQSDDDDDD